MTTRINRKDLKERILGNKSFVGDQEVVGKFEISDFANNVIFEFDPTEKTITVYDDSGNIVWQVDIDAGTITGIPRVAYIPIVMAGASGGGGDSFYTDNTNYVNLAMGDFELNKANFDGASIYLEVVGRAGASGDSARTLSVRLYNSTDSSVPSGSLAETSDTSIATVTDPAAYPLFRSSAITFPSGTKRYGLQFKSSAGGSFVDIYSVKLKIVF